MVLSNTCKPVDGKQAVYVIVRVLALLVPPLLQPRLPVFPEGVYTFTSAVPGSLMRVSVRVTCNCLSLTTFVAAVVPLTTTTVEGTNLLPFTVRTYVA